MSAEENKAIIREHADVLFNRHGDVNSARMEIRHNARLLHLPHLAKVEMLRRIYLFESCSERELRFLATQADAVLAPAGEVLTVQGRSPDTFYMLLEGVVRAKTAGEADVQYGLGAAFDVVAMAERSPARATITAVGLVRMLVMSHAQFRAVAALPRLGDALWRNTSPAGVAPPLQPRHPLERERTPRRVDVVAARR